MGSKEIELTGKERKVREYILPLLPNEEDRYDDLTDEQISQTKSILAQEYVEHGRIRDPTILFILILVYDYLFILEPVLYGLAISAYGSLSAIVIDIHTPSSLADETLGTTEKKEEEIRSKAESSIKMNIIAVSLMIGFITQILATIGVFGTELVTSNIAVGRYESWVGGVVAFTIYTIYKPVLDMLK